MCVHVGDLLRMRIIMDRGEERGPERFWAPLAIEYGSYSPLMAGSIDGTDERPHDRAVERAMRAKC